MNDFSYSLKLGLSLLIAMTPVQMALASSQLTSKEKISLPTEHSQPYFEASRDDEERQRNWVIVPIPVINPLFGAGLVLGGAYFHRQTEE